MTFFQGYASNSDSFDEWSNTLTVETAEGVAADEVTAVPLVRVDTSYKAGRSGEHPVNLTITDAIGAAASLITVSQDSLTGASYAEQPFHDAKALVGVLTDLANLDEAVWELRMWLHAEIEHLLTPAEGDSDKDQDDADAVVFWREAPTSEHRNDGLYPFVFRQDDDGALMLHSVAGDTEHDHVTSDEPRTFLAATKAYGPLVRCDANGRPLDEGQADAAESEAGQ